MLTVATNDRLGLYGASASHGIGKLNVPYDVGSSGSSSVQLSTARFGESSTSFTVGQQQVTVQDLRWSRTFLPYLSLCETSGTTHCWLINAFVLVDESIGLVIITRSRRQIRTGGAARLERVRVQGFKKCPYSPQGFVCPLPPHSDGPMCSARLAHLLLRHWFARWTRGIFRCFSMACSRLY